jgi:hypothetical protein
MDISAKDAFRLGFLTRCAEEGLTGEALRSRIHATTQPEKTANIIQSLVTGVPVAAATLGAGAAGTGLLGGGALGYGAAKMTEPEISDDDIKQQELAETYRIYAERARAKRKARKYRSSGV